MSEEMMQTSPFECPAWFDGKKINETVFCEEFLRDYPMVTVNDAFFTVNGRVNVIKLSLRKGQNSYRK